MNKKIKGYEVMKLIAEKQIKEGQEFLFTNADGDVEEKICWCGDNFRCIDSERGYLLDSIGDIDFATGDFEILEDEEEINIQELEDVNLFDNGQNFNDIPIIIKSYDDNFTNINNTINKLIQVVKQLGKKINKED